MQFKLASELSSLVLKSETEAREYQFHIEQEAKTGEMERMKHSLLRAASKESTALAMRAMKHILEKAMGKEQGERVRIWKATVESSKEDRKMSMEAAMEAAREARIACTQASIAEDAEVVIVSSGVRGSLPLGSKHSLGYLTNMMKPVSLPPPPPHESFFGVVRSSALLLMQQAVL